MATGPAQGQRYKSRVKFPIRVSCRGQIYEAENEGILANLIGWVARGTQADLEMASRYIPKPKKEAR